MLCANVWTPLEVGVVGVASKGCNEVDTEEGRWCWWKKEEFGINSTDEVGEVAETAATAWPSWKYSI